VASSEDADDVGLVPEYEDLSDEQVMIVYEGLAWVGAAGRKAIVSRSASRSTGRRFSCAPLLLRPGPTSYKSHPPHTYNNQKQVEERIDAAAGLISVLPELRPLDRRRFNPGYEVWRAFAAVPAGERHRAILDAEPGALRTLWKASMGRCGLYRALGRAGQWGLVVCGGERGGEGRF
jgi:hypothetical protein